MVEEKKEIPNHEKSPQKPETENGESNGMRTDECPVKHK
jgi:hypothetical protein